jgi:hypothetical protein
LLAAIISRFHHKGIADKLEHRSTQNVLAIRFNPTTKRRTLNTLRWGLIPNWAKDPKIAYKTINARVETVDTAPSYRSASTAGDLRKKESHLIQKSMEHSVIFIVTVVLRRMRKLKNASTISPTKPEIRTWYAFEGPSGDVIHNKRFFFAWKEGCLMGTYNTLEEATASLASKKRRDTH